MQVAHGSPVATRGLQGTTYNHPGASQGHQELLSARVAAAWWQLLPPWKHPGAASGLARGATSRPLPARGSRSNRLAAEVCQWRKLPFPEAVGQGWELLPLPGGAGGSSPLGQVPGAARAGTGSPGSTGARQSTLGAHPPSLGTVLSSVPLYGFFQAVCTGTAQLLPASLAPHPSSQQCHLGVWDKAPRYWSVLYGVGGVSFCCVIWPLLSLH